MIGSSEATRQEREEKHWHIRTQATMMKMTLIPKRNSTLRTSKDETFVPDYNDT